MSLGCPTVYCYRNYTTITTVIQALQCDIILAMALYTVTEAASIARLSTSLIRKALADGKIRAVKIEGLWLIESDSLQAFIDAPRTPGRPVGWRKPKKKRLAQ